MIVRCAINQRQVVIALTGGELVYFEMDPVCYTPYLHPSHSSCDVMHPIALTSVVPEGPAGTSLIDRPPFPDTPSTYSARPSLFPLPLCCLPSCRRASWIRCLPDPVLGLCCLPSPPLTPPSPLPLYVAFPPTDGSAERVHGAEGDVDGRRLHGPRARHIRRAEDPLPRRRTRWQHRPHHLARPRGQSHPPPSPSALPPRGPR